MTPALLQNALALYGLTEDPLLMDSIRVLTSRDQPHELTVAATENIRACTRAYLILYGNSDKHPLHGKLTHTDHDGGL